MRRFLRAKVVLIGDSGVGKTSLILRHERGRFFDDVTVTMGARMTTIPLEFDDLEASIWDTSGQPYLHEMVRSNVYGAQAVFVVFDLTNRQSFEGVSRWLDDLRRWFSIPVPTTILGNKSDLVTKRVVNVYEAERLALSYDAEYFETSALLNTSVKASMDAMVRRMLAMTTERHHETARSDVTTRSTRFNSGELTAGTPDDVTGSNYDDVNLLEYDSESPASSSKSCLCCCRPICSALRRKLTLNK